MSDKKTKKNKKAEQAKDILKMIYSKASCKYKKNNTNK